MARAQTLCGRSPSAPLRFDAARAAVDCRAPWDHLVRACKFHDAPALVPPVPLAATRLGTRGHPRTLPLAADSGLLLRMREAEPERAGRDGALVDAVLTTGSAGAEAARVPKQARAAALEVGERARTPRPDDA